MVFDSCRINLLSSDLHEPGIRIFIMCAFFFFFSLTTFFFFFFFSFLSIFFFIRSMIFGVHPNTMDVGFDMYQTQ